MLPHQSQSMTAPRARLSPANELPASASKRATLFRLSVGEFEWRVKSSLELMCGINLFSTNRGRELQIGTLFGLGPTRQRQRQRQWQPASISFILPSSSFNSSLVLFSLLLLLVSQPSKCLNQVSNQHQTIVSLEPNSIFGSLLGAKAENNPNSNPHSNSHSNLHLNDNSNNINNNNNNNNANSAAQISALSTAQQTAADLHQSYKNAQTSDKVTLPGDILLGGLFPIHMKGTKVECGEINRDRGIQRLEAMLYALDRINEDSKLLPDIKLGAILLDSCSSSTYALNQSLEFIRASINTVESSAFECKDKSTPRPKYGSKMIAGVIGGSYSEVSLQVANLLRLFRIPQVSYASTGTALSDKTLYDLFARTVPSDMFQARAIADIVLKLNWSYVSLVSSEGLYGDSGSKEFMKQAGVRRICIATHEKLSPTADENAYDSIVLSLIKRNATGVVLFTRAEDTRELLLAVKRAKLFQNFAWVAADGWGTHQKLVEGVEDVARGAITVELQAKAIPGFDQYMKALTPWANGRNPWFSEYWQEWFDCQLEANLLQQQLVASGLYNRRETSAAAASSTGGWATSTSNNDYDDFGRAVASSSSSSSANQGAVSGSGSDQPVDDYDTRMRRRSVLGTEPDCHASRRGAGSPASPTNKSLDTPTHTNSSASADAELLRERRSLARAQSNPTSVASALIGQSSASLMKQFCSPNLRISESNGYRQEQKVQFVVDAVYAMAHALHKAWYNLCDAQPGVVCEALKELNGGDFYAKYLLNVSFKDLAGSEVKFDERGDGLGRYIIYNFRQVRPAQTDTGAFNVRANESAATEPEPGTEADSAPEQAAGEGSDTGTARRRRRHAAPSEQAPEEGVAAQGAAGQPTAAPGGQQDQSLVEHIYTSNVEFEYSSIGRWTESDYFIQMDDIQFIQGDGQLPESYCSRPCELGQAKIMRAGDHCCWICKTCAPFEFLPDEFSCRDCGVGRWPIANKTSCFELPQKYLRWDSVYSLISLTIACLGIALTLFVSLIFIKYLDTPVVKASGRELSFILLAGIAFCHLSTFVLLSKPTIFICGSQRFLVNFGFSLMYASLLVKTNRISRIFNCARKSAKRPSFISPKSQMVITGVLVVIQIFLTIVWFILEPPGIRADSPEGKRDEVILRCRAKGKSFIISLVYNMILITTCTVYAVKTRKIPENFNESKFIGFTMYTTIVIWLAFVTMFFGTNNSHEIQINTMCVCISLSAYVTLFCLFSPKISIILLHPDKNVRKLTMNSATYKRPFKAASSNVASADGRNRTPGAAYYGAQNDGPSVGPMSTTSNVLNLAESQAARLQESSIASNVVNSNSAGSNCSNSQKTPTTLSQQLTLVGACSNCGAHQLTQVPASVASTTVYAAAIVSAAAAAKATTIDHHHHHGQQHPGAGKPAPGRLASTPSDSSTAAALAAHHQASRTAGARGTSAALGHQRHRLAAASAAAGATQSSPSSTPPHLSNQSHSHQNQHLQPQPLNRSAILISQGANQMQLGAIAADQNNNTSTDNSKQAGAKVLQSRIVGHPAARADLIKRIGSDDHLLEQQQHHYRSSIDGFAKRTSTASTVHDNAAPDREPQQRANQMSSLSRLNELTSTTSSDAGRRCGIDESISSLANDSFINTSQENTPCNIGAHLHDKNGANLDASNQYMAGKGSDSMIWNQSIYSIDYCSDCCPSYCQHCSCPACSSSNGCGDELGANADTGAVCLRTTAAAAIGGAPSCRGHNNEPFDNCYDNSLMVQDDCINTIGRPSSASVSGAPAGVRRRKSEEPGRLVGVASDKISQGAGEQAPDLARGADAFPDNPPPASTSWSGGRRSQTMEMRIIGPNAASAELATATNRTLASQHQKAPVVYALQSAANSALSTVAQALPPGQRGPEAGITSDKDKFSERGQRSGEPASNRSGGRQSKRKLAGAAGQPLGTIEASIEMVVSSSQQRRQQKAAAGGRKRTHHGQRASVGCFSNYHDDYEYNYGLVDSRSDASDENLADENDDSEENGAGRQLVGRKQEYTALAADERDGGELGADEEADRYRAGPDYNDADADDDEEDEEELGNDYVDDADDGEDEDEDDDFEHDGRVTLARRVAKSAARACQIDERRINSVALIAATLSAGGAIVESAGASGEGSMRRLPGLQQVGKQAKPQPKPQPQQQQPADCAAQPAASSSSGQIEDKGDQVGCLTLL